MDGSRRQVQALSLALIMLLSVVGGSLAFAGSAAATVQDFDGLDAADVTAGTSGVTQVVTLQGLENDGTEGTITISNDAGIDDSVITSASVNSANGHDVTGVNVQSNGDIVVDLGSSGGGVTDNLALDVTHDLSSTQDATVTYTATTDSGISQTASFDVSVAQPEYTDDDATIPETNPDTIEVTFDEPVQEAASPGAHEDAFTLSGAGGVSVSDFNSIKGTNTIVLDLSANVGADETNPSIAYDGDSGSATDPIVHADDSSVVAQDVAAKTVVSNAVPVITDAKVDDGDRDLLKITTSENVDANGLANDAFSLGDDQADVDSVDTATDSSTSIKLSLDSAIKPGADLTGLSYDREAGDVVATADNADELFAQGVTVSNNVVPSIQSAEITSANPDQILVTYDGPVQAGNPGSVLADFTVDTLTIDDDADDDADFTAGNDSQVALPLEGTAQASQGDFTELDYAAGADGVESTAGVDALNADTGTVVTNNVEPIITGATVLDGAPGEVQVTFREDVVANVSGSPNGNLDSAVTEAFEFQNSDVDLRIKNVESGPSSSTITLNFGLADGTSQEVSATDDLAGALSYDPTAPTDDAETFPLIADGGTKAAVPQTQNFDVTNNVDVDVSVAEVTTNGDEIRVTFTEDVTKVGTISEIEDAFVVNSDVVTLDDSNTFSGIENGDTVVFDRSQDGVDFVEQPDNYHSGADFTADSANGIDYTADDGNNPLEVAGTSTAVGDFDSAQDITNNIQPRIVSAEVTNDVRNEIQVTYTEDISGSDGNAYESFSLDGSDAPGITGQNDKSTNTIDLALNAAVASGDDLGTLTYNGGISSKEIISGVSTAVGVDGDSVAVSNNVGSNPILQNVTIDDVAQNNDPKTNGEMLLAFDRAVTVTDGNDDTSGLIFDSGLEGVSVSTVDITDPSGSPDNVIGVTYTSDSGSSSSNIQADDDLSGATLTVDDATSVDISGGADGNQITENTVSDVRNEIAGELATVESTEIDTELIGTEVDAAGEDFTVTVTGLRDANGNRVIDDTVQVDIGGAAPGDLSVAPDRFSDSVTASETPTDISKSNVDIGSEATVDVVGADVTDAATVTYVHEAFDAIEGYQLTSQPMPGEFVAGEGVTDVSYYDADASAFASYGSEGEVQDVHNALFVHAETADAEYGFAYDEDRSGQQTNVGDVPMSEGWHIVGSNYDIDTGGHDLDLSVDLGTENPPSSAAVQVQLESLPGSTLADDATVGSHGVYYVYLHQQDNRPIVLPAYSGTSTASEDTSAAQ